MHETAPTRFVAGAIGIAFALLALAQIPVNCDFVRFAFYDAGSALHADAMWAQGLEPTVDFAYAYGLLALSLQRGWFELFGTTPLAFEGLTLVYRAAIALGLLRLALALQWQRGTVLLLALCLPYVFTIYLNPTHPLESALLLHALAEQARGRSRRALALATICLFVKASMAYVYGLLLTLGLLRDWWCEQRTPRGFIARFGPAALVLTLCASALTLAFGLPAVLTTALPIAGMGSYANAGFGFFTERGRLFWAPPGASWKHYVLGPAGPWLLASLLLLGACLNHAVTRLRATHTSAPPDPSAPMRQRMLLTIAALHFAFVFTFYGWAGSWTYYAYLPVLGATLLIDQSRWRRAWIPAALVAALGLQSSFGLLWGAALYKPRSAETGNLWVYKEQLEDWSNVRSRIANAKAPYVLTNGHLAAFAPELRVPQSWFLNPGLQLPHELDAMRADIQQSDVVVRWNELGSLDPWLFPALESERERFAESYRGPYLTIMRRIERPAAANPSTGADPTAD
jgi:hypothetical protein